MINSRACKSASSALFLSHQLQMFRWISDNTVVVRGGDSDAVQLNKLPVFLAQLDWAVALLDVEISKIRGSNPNNTNVEIADSSEH